MTTQLIINQQPHEVDAAPDTPLLWVLRDHLQLTGTKYGCGMAQCGACTVHLNGTPVRACVTPLQAVAGQAITTIEGLDSAAGKAVQQAWEELNVVQCGYCQSGQIMSAAALLSSNPTPSDSDIDSAMNGNICRCATYVRIRRGIHQAAKNLASEASGKETSDKGTVV
ncbi:MAG: (2Fe-2S)-binding protein [Gammaproteobacteria bacterium]|nr:(2Fe-2S)-binding protein [Gammaproteobacteria bacterium]